jgi:hypothetical protein
VKDMFGFEIHDKPVRVSKVCTYSACRYVAGEYMGQCGAPLHGDIEREIGFCEVHQYCVDAKKAKAAWRSK